MRVRRDEGLAIRIGPEPCAVVREGAGEASAGERAGQPLSRESDISQGADAVTYAEGHTVGHRSIFLAFRSFACWCTPVVNLNANSS